MKLFLLCLAACCGLAQAAAPAMHFFRPAQYKDARISPSGRYIALRAADAKQRDGMFVFDVETLKLVGAYKLDEFDIGALRWVNDKRLVFSLTDTKTAPGNRNYAPGLFGINRDGSELRQLAERDSTRMSTGSSLISRHEPWNTYLMDQEGTQDSDSIYVERPVWGDGYDILRVDLVQLDTVTGIGTSVARPAAAQDWLLDQRGRPAIMTSHQDGKTTVHYRDPAGDKWRALATFDSYGKETGGSSVGGFSAVGFVDDKQLLVRARSKGDKAALYALDLASGAIDPEPMVGLKEFDFDGALVYSDKRLVGLHFRGDAWSSQWFDARLKESQAKVDALLPGRINLITPPSHPQTPWLLVESFSDRFPPSFHVYNSADNKLKTLGHSYPEIKPAEMGKQDFVKYAARDGMEVPAWITTPAAGGTKLPMVVLVHGGPHLRGGEWRWDPVTQFLASRGYAVLEPEFRGSTGYGTQLFHAGFKQWGLKMQDDIADGVKWAVAQGIADPARVCILGGSYGGYAALMGLVKDGGLYRCGVAYAAVTDIPLMFENGGVALSDMSEEYRKYGAPVLVGDPVQDREQLAATSPLKQAARIQRPLLLAHGSDDLRVPAPHFRQMRAALGNRAGAEYVEYPGEGHGWSLLSTRLDFWTRVEKFLDKHIGAGAKTE